METTPRPNPHDAGQPHFRPGERRPLRASAYWIIFAVAGAVATARWQMVIQAAGSIAQVTTLHLVGTFSTPLLCAGVVCVLAGLRARSR